MKFNEEKAKQVIEKFSLSPTTLNVWRYRGQIPKKYADLEPSERVSKVKLDRFIKCLNTRKIHKAVLCRNAEISYTKLVDVLNSKSDNLTEHEYLQFKKRISEIKISLRKLKDIELNETDLKTIEEIVNIPELAVSVIFSKKWLGFKNKTAVSLNIDDYRLFKKELNILTAELYL